MQYFGEEYIKYQGIYLHSYISIAVSLSELLNTMDLFCSEVPNIIPVNSMDSPTRL